MSLNIIKNYIDKTKKNKKEYNNDKKNVENVFPFFEQMRNYLIKKGKTHTIENLISAYLFQRAVKKQINFQNILSNTIQNSTPYLKLRMRKWGRKIKYKIKLIEQEDLGWKTRKALGYISKILRNSSEDKFINGFEKELELLYKGKSNVKTKRDEYHRLILEQMPYSWSRKLGKFKNIQKNKKLEVYQKSPKNVYISEIISTKSKPKYKYLYTNKRKIWWDLQNISKIKS